MNAENFKQSRIGKLPVAVPAGIDVKIKGRTLTVKGPKGVLERTFNEGIDVKLEDGHLHVVLSKLTTEGRALSGLSRSLVNNMIIGVSTGYERRLDIIGTGYRAELRGTREINFVLGYSHPILFELPEGVTAEISKDNKITLRSADKEVIGRTAAKIRSFRKPEPYKGKGIKYAEEVIVRKAGKTSGK